INKSTLQARFFYLPGKSPVRPINKEPDTRSGSLGRWRVSGYVGRKAQLGDFLVQQVDALGHALNQTMSNSWIALHQAQELFLGYDHNGAGLAGQHSGAALLAGEYRHGTEDFILLHITDLVPVDI